MSTLDPVKSEEFVFWFDLNKREEKASLRKGLLLHCNRFNYLELS